MAKGKYILMTTFALFFANRFVAQDLQIWNERDIDGTARYVGLSGAMTAVGGDPTAVNDNPAGLGLYRRSEFLCSFLTLNNYDVQKSAKDGEVDVDLSCNQVSFIFSFGDDEKTKGLIHNNLMFSYNRVKTFQNTYSGTLLNRPSTLPTLLAKKTNGLQESSLRPETRWEDSNIGWLSPLGYDAELINPAENNQWTPAYTGNSDNTLTIKEKGYVNDCDFDWGMNWNNRLYLGLGLTIRHMVYQKDFSYKEETNGYNSVSTSFLSVKGLALNSSIGFIYQPVRFMRIGMSYQTPSVTELRLTTYGDMTSSFQTNQVLTPEDGPATYSDLVFPYRLTAGVAFLCGKKGLMSFEYDYENWKELSATHSLKVGLEYVAHDYLFFNLGGAYESYFLNHEPTYIFNETTTRTDPDYRNLKYRYYLSGGVGYRGSTFIAQVAYQYMNKETNFYANELQVDPFQMCSRAHRVVFTLGWHTNR